MKKHLGKIVAGVAILLGLVAALLIFAGAIAPKEGAGDPISGASIAFGNKDDKTVASLYILAFLLPLVGVILSVLTLLGKGGKVVPIIAAVCFVVGGIFYFLPLELVTPDLGKLSSAEAIKNFRDMLKKVATVGLGAIFGGILSILAGCASVATLFVKKK